MLPVDTGSVELNSYKQYISSRLAQGAARNDGRTSHTEVRLPSVVYEKRAGEARSGGSAPLASLMYADDRGSCLTCEVSGVFGPPPLASRKEGRLTVHVTAPLLRRHGTEARSGGTEMLRSSDVISTGQEGLALRQVEGFVSSVLRRCIDLRQLSLIEGEACWVLSVHLVLLNVDGGLYGAALAAAVSALKDLALPRSQLPNGDVVEPRTLTLSSAPLACTYGVLAHPAAGVRWLADLSAGEELVVDSHLTLTLDENDLIVDVRQVGPTAGVEGEVVKHWIANHRAVRKALGWPTSKRET